MASLSCRISPRTSTVIFLERSPLATAMVTSAMLRTCAVRLPAIWLTESVSSFQTPDTRFTCAWPPSLPSVPTSRATRVTSAVKSASCSIIGIHELGRAEELALQLAAVDLELHRLAEVAARDRADGARDLGGGTHQIVDEGVERFGLGRPPADGAGQRHALAQPAFLADRRAEAGDLARHPLGVADRLVERLGDAGVGSRPVRRQPHREVAIAEGDHGGEQQLGSGVDGVGGRGRAPSRCRGHRSRPKAAGDDARLLSGPCDGLVHRRHRRT